MAKGSGTTKYQGSSASSAAKASGVSWDNTKHVFGDNDGTFEGTFHVRTSGGAFYVFKKGVPVSNAMNTLEEAKLAGYKSVGMDISKAITQKTLNETTKVETINAPSGSTTFYTKPLYTYTLGKDVIRVERESTNGFTEYIAREKGKSILHSQSESTLKDKIKDYLVKKNK